MQEFIDKYYTKDGKLFRKFDNKEIGWKSNNNYLKFDENGKKYKDVH